MPNTCKNYVDTTTNGGTIGIIYYILSTIPMSVIHSIFKALPSTKNMHMKLDITFNTNISTTLTIQVAGLTYTGMATSSNTPTCPYTCMISPLGPFVSALATATGLTASANAQTPVVSIEIAKILIMDLSIC